MASGLVYRVRRQPPEAKMFGFQHMERQEVNAVSNRLYSKHTSNTHQSELERMLYLRGEVSRQPVRACRRANSYRVSSGNYRFYVVVLAVFVWNSIKGRNFHFGFTPGT